MVYGRLQGLPHYRDPPTVLYNSSISISSGFSMFMYLVLEGRTMNPKNKNEKRQVKKTTLSLSLDPHVKIK